MSRTSTKRNSNTTQTEKPRSERILLVALLAVGVLGLAISYAGKSARATDATARAIDTTSASSGKARGDHMILNLDQRGVDSAEPVRTSRF